MIIKMRGYAYLSISNTKALRGIMALTIILCHSRGRMLLINDTIVGAFFTALAYLVVGMFFFLTGYGLRESSVRKSDYKNKFFKSRILTFYVDCLIFISIYVAYRIFTKQEVSIGGVIGSATVFDTYVINGWYLQVAVLVYLGFYIAWKISGGKYEKIILLTLLAVYIITWWLSDKTITWVQSILGIPMGYLWSEKKNELDAFINKHYVSMLIGGAVSLFSMVIIGNWYVNGILSVAIKAISVCFFIILSICVLKAIPIKNKLFIYLGEISLELYVVHGLWIDILGNDIDTWGKTVMFFAAVMVCSILTASVLHKLIKQVNLLIKRI